MQNFKNIKAILFDAGGTLCYASSGDWFIPPNFYNHVCREKFASLNPEAVKTAFAKGINHLTENHLVLTEEEEYEAFAWFYGYMNDELGMNLSGEAISELAKGNVYEDNKFVFYDDVADTLDKLGKNYMLGVVSDTWPSLDRVFANAGLRHYFSSFVMSSILGVVKPNELMYMTAINELGIRPEEALFIDDMKRNVDGAAKLGIKALLIRRPDMMRRQEVSSESATADGGLDVPYFDGDYLCINNISSLLHILNA